MATKSDNVAAWVLGGLAALGLVAMASSSRSPKRQMFQNALRGELSHRGLRLVLAELGLRRGTSVWVVTCETPEGRVLSTEVPVAGPPYENPNAVAESVFGALAEA